MHERRNLRLTDAEDFSRRGLREPLAFDDLQDFRGKFRLEEGESRVPDGDVGKHVAAASLNTLRLHAVALS